MFCIECDKEKEYDRFDDPFDFMYMCTDCQDEIREEISSEYQN